VTLKKIARRSNINPLLKGVFFCPNIHILRGQR
jgi:hypothetical protein